MLSTAPDVISAKSPPAQNALPSPVSTIDRTSSAPRASSSAQSSSLVIRGPIALRFSGLLSVIVSTPPSRATLMRPYSRIYAPALRFRISRACSTVAGLRPVSRTMRTATSTSSPLLLAIVVSSGR